MASRGVLDAGAALGAAAFVVSVGGLVAQHAPGVTKVADATPGDNTSAELRLAELTSGGVVIFAGGVAAAAMREWWPLLLAATAVGGAIGVYELLLFSQRRRAAG